MSRSAILIVDDNDDLLDLLEEILGNLYHILRANSARQAFELLEAHPVTLVISDVMMPGVDGFEFCDKFKSDQRYAHIPIILLTAKSANVSRIEGLESGADAYITKPFSPRHLKAQIESLLRNRLKVRDYFSVSPFVQIRAMAENKDDEQFLDRLYQLITNHIDHVQLDVDFLAGKLFMSRSSLYRRIRQISNLSVNELINLVRLKRGAELLAEGRYKVSEVSNMLGFSSPNHFNRVFSKQFNMSPTTFLKRIDNALDETPPDPSVE